MVCEFLLSKNCGWISWEESRVDSLTILNPIERVWCGGVGFPTPLDLIGLVVLGIVPGMVSLGVWCDVGGAVSNWVDLFMHLSLSKRSQWGFIIYESFRGLEGRVKIVWTNSCNVSLPLSLVRLVSLSTSPSIVSLIVI